MKLPIEAIRKRRSIRRYEDKPVPDEALEQILETIRYAPSWANKQGWQVMVLKTPEARNLVSSVLEGNPAQKAVTEAPVLLVVCMDPNASGIQNGKEYYMADAGILMDHIMLEAADLGLGTVFIGLFDEDKVREALKVPEQWRIVAMTPIGYPAKMPKERPRKELEEILHWEKW
ncbi:MAG: nitroreductase family protein [Actinomycetota bacterium]|nr:nitroreductase family protein [Actinomycetota bacterium]